MTQTFPSNPTIAAATQIMPRGLPEIDAVAALKRGRGAVILAHNYPTPDICHEVTDITGGSLALA